MNERRVINSEWDNAITGMDIEELKSLVFKTLNHLDLCIVENTDEYGNVFYTIEKDSNQ